MADLPEFEEPLPGMSDEEGQEKFNKKKKNMKKLLKKLSDNMKMVQDGTQNMNIAIDNLIQFL